MQVEVVLDAAARIGESPVWVAEERVLYWIDVKAPALYRLDPASKAQQSWRLPGDIGAYSLTTDRDVVIVALRDGVYRLTLSSGAVALLAHAPFDPVMHRFNEGAADARGRFWVGTMFDPPEDAYAKPQPAGLFRYTTKGGLQPTGNVAELHNGMAWNLDETLFYLAHSYAGVVHAYPFDAASGSLGRRQVFAAIEKPAGIPDGAAIDCEGGYWCALHGGGGLRRFRADGVLEREVRLPVSQPTMCAFGGEALDILYITSASKGLDASQRAREPHAGAILAIHPGVTGLPREHRFTL
ncbi:SMP-30/gluconolactonase/LRE family protein [Lichenicoccus sp.]|uniref:SMP-30/gluconolactonase/LRE family protein n=1 Tax=Lichenicoccus sp. TaxID=2781899 RepID=UPI003D10A7CD